MSEIRPELALWVAYLEKKEQLEEAQDRIVELEAALQKKGCARDQKTTQYCAEVISRDARIAELENLVAYLCGKNTDHICVALAGNPIVVDAVVARAEAALEGGK